ncbi:ATP-dependent nuclease [Streptomyces megasporus]|uniref:ATP-dependent nuclease n=1 Tax=Streptomyces megasporus TaxID=44060 RepID=UPI0004E2012B|nr:AAA family ATPase [Streptomyces megasporus]
MQFTVLEYRQAPTRNQDGAFLMKDSWDDYGYVTTFDLRVRQEDGRLLYVGYVRIAHVEMGIDEDFYATADRLPTRFESLPEGYFSLAHQDTYYEKLNELPEDMRHAVLAGLRDIAYAPEIIPDVEHLAVFRDSLMRGTNRTELDRLMLIARGRDRVVPFRWSYTPPAMGAETAPTLVFEARPDSLPPTNLHALIGRNGVGKSSLLRDLAQRVATGDIPVSSDEEDVGALTNCVAVSFSAFDQLYTQQPDGDTALPFTYIGLQTEDPPGQVRLKTEEELTQEFIKSFGVCRIGARGERWRAAVDTLSYAASGFLEGHRDTIESLMRGDERRIVTTLAGIFRALSSGHKIALLIVTRLIEAVTERTLVLIDEPETHLHPPLLSALMRSLSDLLTDRNGMAVMATHSPVVLQEVPASCVYKLRRYGDVLVAERPVMETYGENVGELTHEAFGLEVTSTGYHAALVELVEQDLSYEEIIDRFSDLGSEAKGLLRAMTVLRSRGRRD